MARLLEDDIGRPKPQIETADGLGFQAWKGENNAGRITGDIDHDATDAGKPVKIGGKASDVAPAAVAAGDRVNAWFDLNGRLLVKMDSALPAGTNNIGGVVAKGAAPADAKNPGDGDVSALLSLFNGTGWDRQRNNQVGALLASAARTATISSSDQTNYNGRELQVILQVTALSGAPSITLKIEGKTALGAYYTLLEGVAVTAAGIYVYSLFPGATPETNKVVNGMVPRTWRVTVTHANVDSITYSVCYALN